MTDRFRNVIADVLIGLVLLFVAYWLLRSVIGMVVWTARLVVFVLVVALVARVVLRLRT